MDSVTAAQFDRLSDIVTVKLTDRKTNEIVSDRDAILWLKTELKG